MISERRQFAEEITSVCQELLDGSIDFVSGSRYLRKLYLKAPETEKELFFPIIGFESETDDYPIGEDRQKYDSERLKKLDTEIFEYISRVKPAIEAACRKLLEFYGSK